MKPHPSLTAEFDEAERIFPVEFMDPYKPCWCGSGVKWKWCHKVRESEVRWLPGQIIAETRKAARLQMCMHPESSSGNCAKKIIKAHTIQRRGGLRDIAEQGHVLSVKDGAYDVFANEGRVIPKLVGVGNASTFQGFCGLHDDAMFKPIETGAPVLNSENVFLLAFRALAYELYEKHRSLIVNNKVHRRLDMGRPFRDQAATQLWCDWSRRGAAGVIDREFGIWKAAYDHAYLGSAWSDFSFHAVELDRVLPVAACGAFQPEVSFDGRQLQILSRGQHPMDHVAVCMTTLGGSTVMVFGWIGANDGPAADFVESFKTIPDDEKANAAIHLMFEHIENLHMRPSWFDGLHDKDRVVALSRINSGIGGGRLQDALTNLEPRYTDAIVVASFSS